jgi:D-alanyl-D-alanine dipeptidase
MKRVSLFVAVAVKLLLLLVLVGCQLATPVVTPAVIPTVSPFASSTGLVISPREIPSPRAMAGWKTVPIRECGEALVELNSIHPRVVVDAKYTQQGIAGASSQQYLRKGVADRLVDAANRLPEGYKFVVFDAYRPLAVQQALFDSFKAVVEKEMPGRSNEEILEATQRYVSLPSSDLTRPSPHATGGAIDLSILGPDGKALDMGTEFDSFEVQAGTAYYMNRPESELIYRNRQLLYTLMVDAGFTNYPEEWWHFDYGNQFWGHLSGKDAIYNLVDALPLSAQQVTSAP